MKVLDFKKKSKKEDTLREANAYSSALQCIESFMEAVNRSENDGAKKFLLGKAGSLKATVAIILNNAIEKHERQK